MSHVLLVISVQDKKRLVHACFNLSATNIDETLLALASIEFLVKRKKIKVFTS